MSLQGSGEIVGGFLLHCWNVNVLVQNLGKTLAFPQNVKHRFTT